MSKNCYFLAQLLNNECCTQAKAMLNCDTFFPK
jgi:hypothetical protein